MDSRIDAIYGRQSIDKKDYAKMLDLKLFDRDSEQQLYDTQVAVLDPEWYSVCRRRKEYL